MDTLISKLKYYYDHSQNKLFCKFIAQQNIEEISYKKLIEKSSQYALHYKNKGLVKGDFVIIILKHSPDLIYSFIGAIMMGAIPSIFAPPSEKQDKNLHKNSIEKLSKRIGAKSIITSNEYNGEMKSIAEDLGIDMVTPDNIGNASEIIWTEDINEDDIAFLQHSSGTTGLKKGVALSHKVVLNQLDNYSKSIELNQNDIIISWLPLYHDMGLITCLIMPIFKKVPLIMMDPFEWITNPKMLFEYIEKDKATICWIPNFAYNLLALYINPNEYYYNLSSMRAIINCSEPCKSHSFEMFYNSFNRYGLKKETLQTCYAMAETVFGVTQSEIGKNVKIDYVDKDSFINKHYAEIAKNQNNARNFLSVGKVISNTQVKIVDDNRNELGERYVGEIKIKSNSLFQGYFKLPEETAKDMDDEWYFSGDLGYLADNELYITGRKKDLIIVHGKNYYAHDIEYIANQINGIKKGRCVAVGIYDERIGSEYVILIAETNLLSEEEKYNLVIEIKKRVSEDLNLLLKEVYLVPLKWLIKTTSGKISRNENKIKYLNEKFDININE